MIHRRTFFAIFCAPRIMVLEAIAAPKMPTTILVPGSRLQGPVFEIRKYSGPVPLHLFRRSGIEPVRQSKDTYLIPFRSLRHRQIAWDALAADPEWQGLHPSEISIYRRIA